MGRNNGNKQKAREQKSKRTSDPRPDIQALAVRQARLKLKQAEAGQVERIEAGRPALPVELKTLEKQFGPKRTNAR